MLIKVCGLKNCPANQKLVELPGLDMAGFIRYNKSPRFTDDPLITKKKERVGVFVNADLEEIEQAIKAFGLTVIQLHGDESPEFTATVKQRIKTIKAFGISQAADFERTAAYEGTADYFLFDTKTEKYGGSGEQFDWIMLMDYKGQTPFFVSGGIAPHSLFALKQIRHPKLLGVDLNSRFEDAPGIKNYELVKKFIESLKK